MKLLLALMFVCASALAAEIEVDAAMLDAIEMVESSGNPNAVARDGGRGAYQFMEPTWKWLWTEVIKKPENADFNKAFDRALAREAAQKYFVWIRKFLTKKLGEHSWDLDIAAYNAGVGAVIKYKGIPPFKITQNYVVRVNKIWKRGGN